jgi:uncharacterized membrane protein YfcA
VAPIAQLVIFVAAICAGAINAIAGGGTVFSFSALVWAGLPTVRANATNALALVPGSVGGVVAMRRELRAHVRTFAILFVPTMAGSLLGAVTVANTSEDVFKRIVPFLILFATIIFAARNAIVRMTTRESAAGGPASEHITAGGFVIGCIFQFAISFYGGYFGAGIGILMLTSLSIIGMHDIINMNAVKNALAITINGTAATFFVLAQKIEWQAALIGATGAVIGGYVLARLARRINQHTLRIAIVVAGLVVSTWMFYRTATGQ